MIIAKIYGMSVRRKTKKAIKGKRKPQAQESCADPWIIERLKNVEKMETM